MRFGVLLAAAIMPWQVATAASAEPSPHDRTSLNSQMARWLGPQEWRRDTDGPVISLGRPGAFDDTHVFAPCVARVGGKFMLWYCGSRGAVAQRMFRLGLATGHDGVHFAKSRTSSVMQFGDGKHSILTPTLLRRPDGSALREEGRLRMWFASTHFAGQDRTHTLHETSSADGVRWSARSPPQLGDVYAPTIVKEDGVYRMWYTDVSVEPWSFRFADSKDGRRWRVRERPVMIVDQPWETGRLFYPTVVKADGLYVMWYGSYWSRHPNKTAIGSAVSVDGIAWRKNPNNPVLRPDPNRPWESHYTTSQSVLRVEDGTWRIWYASRKAPPFRNKYYAICTARWSGPKPVGAVREPPLRD